MAKADSEQALESQLAQHLKHYGYEITTDAKIKGSSGTEHTFAMLAHKDAGFFSYDIVIGLSVSQREEVGLGAIFNFDEKANDVNIPDKIFIAIPKLGAMAVNFAQQQRIKVFDNNRLDAFLNTAPPQSAKHHKPVEFSSRAQLLKSLTEHGYRLEENAKVKGISGIEHTFDVLAYIDDGLITHPVSIDFLSANDEVDMEPVSLLDARAQDTGIIRSVLVASPKLSHEAKQLAERQQITVFEVAKATPQKPTHEPHMAKNAPAQSSTEPTTVKVTEPAPAPVTKPIPIEPVVTGPPSGVARLNVLTQAPTPEALNLIPEKLARKYNVVPLAVDDNTLRVAMANPDDVLAIQALAAKTKRRIEAVLATPIDIQEAIDFNYKAFSEIAKQFGMVAPSIEVIPIDRSAEVVADDSPVAKALSLLVEEGVKSRSSDIHIEPEIDRLRVRYRIDGILHEVTSLPVGAHGPLISRIKILAGMNIADPRRPQDGQFSVVTTGRDIDIRVATISTVHGETAVLRLLDKSMAVMSLSQLGFLPESQERFERMLMAPYGMVLLSGPTGAGKTTTLYAAVNSLDKVGRNIITIEDPVEYRFRGVNQIQINPKAGVTFASGLRAIVRLDPDVILVGEIRDSETADIATQSALTGHLVLSSVHANDTVGVLFRLIDLGVEPFLICSAVICIVAQRMVRRVCPNCARKTNVPIVEQAAYHRETGEERSEFASGAGCKMCTYTGYLGRTGIFEILTVSDEIKRAIVTGAPAAEIRAKAIEEGMLTLAKDGMLKARAGITTPYEVLRNAYSIGD
ncbi:MAG: type II/IV secretion system protein [Chloroflexi bacterium]|nr:type II/IV secretion system protein [Chloroflexota bacterium]